MTLQRPDLLDDGKAAPAVRDVSPVEFAVLAKLGGWSERDVASQLKVLEMESAPAPVLVAGESLRVVFTKGTR